MQGMRIKSHKGYFGNTHPKKMEFRPWSPNQQQGNHGNVISIEAKLAAKKSASNTTATKSTKRSKSKSTK